MYSSFCRNVTSKASKSVCIIKKMLLMLFDAFACFLMLLLIFDFFAFFGNFLFFRCFWFYWCFCIFFDVVAYFWCYCFFWSYCVFFDAIWCYCIFWCFLMLFEVSNFQSKSLIDLINYCETCLDLNPRYIGRSFCLCLPG